MVATTPEISLGSILTEKQARDIYAQGEEAVVFALLQFAQRAIRPAVIIRKNSYSNRSDQGADVQAILMSIFFMLKKRGHNPINTICNALTTYLKTGQLPPMPATNTADG